MFNYLGFKTDRLRKEWNSGHMPAYMQDIVEHVALRRWEELEKATVITCIHSTKEEDEAAGRRSATHREWRAVDYRVQKGDAELGVEDQIRKEVCVSHPTGIKNMPRIAPLRHGTAPHGHVQITIDEKKDDDLGF